MNSEQKHSEIPIEQTWDLTLLYKNEADWENDFSSLDGLLADFNVLKGKLAEGPEQLKQAAIGMGLDATFAPGIFGFDRSLNQ